MEVRCDVDQSLGTRPTGRRGGPGGQLRSTVANTQRPEAEMAKKSRKKKARRKNAANHGKRPNA
jgi:hypothetical protein